VQNVPTSSQAAARIPVDWPKLDKNSVAFDLLAEVYFMCGPPTGRAAGIAKVTLTGSPTTRRL